MPVNAEAWVWYHGNSGNESCPVVDTGWQTETGGHMVTSLPGVTTAKPGTATTPVPGIYAEVVDDDGNTIVLEDESANNTTNSTTGGTDTGTSTTDGTAAAGANGSRRLERSSGVIAVGGLG